MGELCKYHIRVLFGLIIFMILILPSVVMAKESESIHIFINDQRLVLPDVNAEVTNGSTYIPIRNLADEIGVSTVWDAATERVHLSKDEQELILDINENQIYSAMEQFDVPLYTQNGRMMAPLRLVGEFFGYTISFISDGPIVRLKDGSEQLTDDALAKQYKAQLEQEKLKVNKKGKPAYLTFDDGPNDKSTKKILDILETYNAKATFFMLDGNVAKYPNLVKRMVQDGHGIGSHGVTHIVEKFYSSKESVINEMKQGLNRLKKITDVDTKLIRVPYGSKPHMKQAYIEAVNKAGYKMWDWNVDSYDWKYAKEPQQIITTVIGTIERLSKRGEAPIILMHDKEISAQVLPEIIEYLRKNGYELLPLNNEMKPHSFK